MSNRALNSRANSADGQAVAHGDGETADEGGALGPQQVAFDRAAADGVGPIQDQHFHAARPRGFHAVGQGVDERVDPGAGILEVDQQGVDVGEHLRAGNPGTPVQAQYREAERRIDQVGGLDHVVLFFREKPVLRGKERAQGAAEPLVDQLPGVPQPMVDCAGVAKQPQPEASHPEGRIVKEAFEAGTDAFHDGCKGSFFVAFFENLW